MSGAIHPLKDNQVKAVDPQDSVWLSASAGTGKTQVLSARVLRLLLQRDVSPSQILCLTFTKAGAAEMATRVNDVLARWVRMKPEPLAKELQSIGASVRPEVQDRARSLFASVLDCPGGGLRIDTIHAFAQWLLGAFPEEAGLLPGTRAMEDRDRDLLAHRVLADLLVDWHRSGEEAYLDALADLSVRMGPEKAQAWLMRCAQARELWYGAGGWPDDLTGRLKSTLGIHVDAGTADLTALLEDDNLPLDSIRACLAILERWGTDTAQKGIGAIQQWLALDNVARANSLACFEGSLFNKTDFYTPERKGNRVQNILAKWPEYENHLAHFSQTLDQCFDLKHTLDLVEWLAPALRIGRQFALRWDEAKKREGLIDFDDQIRSAAALLSRADVADWIRYKLDRQFDHILIDEAQDTNAAQWSIIKALSGDFFSGLGQRDAKMRTIFVVGDYKQAIFGFQGTSPENFETAKAEFRREMADAAANAPHLRDGTAARELRDLGLGRSYRTAQPVLEFVDAAIARIGTAAFGLNDNPGAHSGDDRPGEVVLWNPVKAEESDEDLPEQPDERDDRDERENNSGEEGWISAPERRMADKIAQQIKDWLHEGYPLVKGARRNAGPGDIMVLVRRRKELAGLIVARLHAAGIPVAGVDRLRLGAPLAVKDLMAVLRFAAQPLDDLSLANLLVSPLGGWSQQDLLDHAYRDKGVALWDHLRASEAGFVQETVEKLRDVLRRTDFEPPQALLHWILTGPWQGRRKLVARLGREAIDPMDELLNAAFAYAGAHTPSVQGFIQWFDAGEGELKREAGASDGLVRVMTVHGSKGLQAPIVILADATGDPAAQKTVEITLPDGDRAVPIPLLSKELSIARVDAEVEKAKALEMQEHWRLLYVAMTRAEEALFIGGTLGKKKDEPPEASWYAALAPIFSGEILDDPSFGGRRVWGQRPADVLPSDPEPDETAFVVLPAWVQNPVGPEPKPPRPLAPSSAGEDNAADPPLPPDHMRQAARRGVLIHRLLERLPDIAEASRRDAAALWLERNAAELAASERKDMLDAALAIVGDPRFADFFAPGSLAEVPLSANVAGTVVTGTVDRLLVTERRVTVVDYKTARRPPAGLEEVPEATLRQMAAYVAALEVIYPGREIRAALLYTQRPLLIDLPEGALEPYKNRLSTSEQSFAAPVVE